MRWNLRSSLTSSLAVSLSLSLALTACSGSGSSGSSAPQAAAVAPAATTPAPAPATPATPVSTHPNVGVTVPVGPIVLVHGVDPVSLFTSQEVHFIGIPTALQNEGASVIRPMRAGMNSIDLRARQLKDAILAAYPDPSVKVNLIAHSMGGLDARYMITHLAMADRVASLTTISTPHRGTPISDVALGILPGPSQQVLDTMLNVIGWDLDFAINTSEDYIQNTFNPSTPNHPGVFYQSWAGRCDPIGATGARVRAVLIPTWTVIAADEGANDGIIPVSSSQWGLFRGTIGSDHFGELGLPQRGFDHTQFYLDVAEDLAQRGF